ncbi:MAG TPA: hypothetical protein VHA30_04045, partial [Patescibacteria group bacterium]|nr:hypothetical protein [Patescibacteria group bacterium]
MKDFPLPNQTALEQGLQKNYQAKVWQWPGQHLLAKILLRLEMEQQLAGLKKALWLALAAFAGTLALLALAVSFNYQAFAQTSA